MNESERERVREREMNVRVRVIMSYILFNNNSVLKNYSNTYVLFNLLFCVFF